MFTGRVMTASLFDQLAQITASAAAEQRLPRTKAAMKQRTILVARFVSLLLCCQLNLAP